MFLHRGVGPIYKFNMFVEKINSKEYARDFQMSGTISFLVFLLYYTGVIHDIYKNKNITHFVFLNDFTRNVKHRDFILGQVYIYTIK